jgi:hypothetical protein
MLQVMMLHFFNYLNVCEKTCFPNETMWRLKERILKQSYQHTATKITLFSKAWDLRQKLELHQQWEYFHVMFHILQIFACYFSFYLNQSIYIYIYYVILFTTATKVSTWFINVCNMNLPGRHVCKVGWISPWLSVSLPTWSLSPESGGSFDPSSPSLHQLESRSGPAYACGSSVQPPGFFFLKIQVIYKKSC